VDTVQPLLEEINMNFRKTVLAISLSACTGAAVAADKVPTLGDVLQASGINVSGYIDATYTNFSSDMPLFHAYTTEKNSFNLNAVDLAVSSLPASGFGGMVEVMAGEDPTFNASKGWSTANFDLLQAYGQYASGPLTIMGGKFTTLAGAEVAQAPANANISRSLLYTLAIPVTHTGLRGSYVAGDTMKFTVGFNNGWDVLRESAATNCVGTNCADGKTIELGASLSPSKMFGLTASYYMGEEAGVTAVGDRTLLDIVATLNATDALSFVLNYDMGDQDNGTATGGTAEWDGWAAYANYAFTDKLRGSLRIESFDDKDGFRTGTVQELESLTLTVGYAAAKNVDLRAEFRQDESDSNVFTEDGSAKDSQTFFGLEAIYKF
jgi:hypothetical protein